MRAHYLELRDHPSQLGELLVRRLGLYLPGSYVRLASGEVAVVVNELTTESRGGLAQGWVTMVDATPLPDLCREVLALMQRAIRDTGSVGAGQVFLPVQLHVAESI